MEIDATQGPIGVFDSGYGGLTVFREIKDALPEYDYLYLGDNARTPYGTRSQETVYDFTLQGVEYLFSKGCSLIILACNTASATALRTIQQSDLHRWGEDKRVLGVIRPTTERLSELTRSGHLGLFATEATVQSRSYIIEGANYAPEVTIHQQACPMWVPIIENDEQESQAADYFTAKYVNALLKQHQDIDAVLLACTHYPILAEKIRSHLPKEIDLISQGTLVAESLVDYLSRHQWMQDRCSQEGRMTFLTTDSPTDFDTKATKFFNGSVKSEHVTLL
ncbi:MAG: glutamate racemase [Flavobacteriales bacterium]|nr:glutamate racemase [Flavobacteriales bacterium]